MPMMHLIEPENAARADGSWPTDQPTNAWLADVVRQGSRLECSQVERAAAHALEGLRPSGR